MYVTISREYGAGGSTVARRVAEELGWRLVDNQLIEEVAKRAGVSVDDVAGREERGPTFIERIARALAVATPELLGPDTVAAPEAEEERLVKITEQVVADLCAEGDTVFVGRAAVAMLGDRADALHVRLVASPAHRAGVVATRLGIPLDEATQRVRDTDAQRTRYHRQWYNRDWADARNYHLTLNTERLGIERSAAIVVAAVRGGEGET
jgi:cytidylate kinase